jgi:hypothetical protein
MNSPVADPPQTVTAAKPRRSVWRILVFLALVATVLTALDQLIDGGLRRITTAKYGSLNRIMAGRVGTEIIISGSSRAAFHYDSRKISEITGRSTYNIGMIGARIDVQLGLLKAYLKHNRPPRVVLLNLETSTFTMTPKGEITDPGLFAPHLYEDELYQPLLKVDPAVWKWRHIPLYVYAVEDQRFVWARGLGAWFGLQGPETFHDGFNPNFERWGADFYSFRAYAQEGRTYPLDPAAVATLTELMRVCTERGIELFLVLSPEFHEAQSIVRNRAEIFAVFHRLSTEFKVTFWDYSDSPLSRERDNFYSSQHLNADGATLFSADLARRLKSHSAVRSSP